MTSATLKLYIPASTTAAPVNHHRDTRSLAAFPQNHAVERKLSLEAVKRIWLSYSPVNVRPRTFATYASRSDATSEKCRALEEENVLCLDLGLTASAMRSAASNIGTDPLVNTAAPVLSQPHSPRQPKHTAGAMEGERELGELSDDSRGESVGPQIDLTSTCHFSLNQARSALTDSLFKSLKTRDPQCNQSREHVFQKYVAHLDDHQLSQLMTIGRDIFDDLSKMGDVKRKLSSATAALPEDDRRVKRRLGDEISPVEAVLSRSEAHHGVNASLPPPHILMVKEGRPHATTIDATFDLSDVLVSSATELPFRIVFCCILKSIVVEITRSEKALNSSSYLAEAFSKIDTSWPAEGGLFVSLNYGHPEKAGILTPQNFTEAPHQIDITNYVLPGENTIRLIHLHDHSSYVFFVLAVPRILGGGRIESHLMHRGRVNFT